MLNGRNVVRRVTKRSYDKYTIMEQEPLTDNLNPIKPTELESQLADVKNAVRLKILGAYSKTEFEVPDDLYDVNVSPGSLLNDINNLINKVRGKNALDDWEDKIGGNPANIYPILSQEEDGSMDNPPILDCEGIDTSAFSDRDSSGSGSGSESSDEENGETDGDGNGGGDTKSTEIKITYKNLCEGEDTSSWPQSLLPSEFPYNFMTNIPVKFPKNQTFEGWYLDKDFQEKVFSKTYAGEKEIVVYANFVEEADANKNDPTPKGDDSDGNNSDDGCDEVELEWLKIILIIILIVTILVQVFVLIYNIQKAIADILKDAQLAWINPPSLQSLLSYVMQRLSAVLFQIVGLILMKLWAMLDLDCISDNVTKTLDQVNSAMSSLMNLMNEINALALGMGKGGGLADLLNSLLEAIKNLKEDFKKQKDALVNEIENIPKTLGKFVDDQKKFWTNPATYLAMVPPEIKGKINGMLSTMNQTKTNIKNLQTSINNMVALFTGEEQPQVSNDTPNVSSVTD